MEFISHDFENIKIIEVISEDIIISNAEDGLDLVGNIYFSGYDYAILYSKNISPDFFDLKSGIAGEILQKFSNYRIRLAIVGEFADMQSRSFLDFMTESNKHGHIIFVASLQHALDFFKVK